MNTETEVDAKSDLKTIAVKVTDDQHYALKRLALDERTSLQSLVNKLVVEAIAAANGNAVVPVASTPARRGRKPAVK